MNFNTAKQGLNILIQSGILDADIGIFSILTSNFVLRSRSISEWANRIYFSFLISQIRDFFIKNPRLRMLVNTFDKMSPEKKENHIINAEKFLRKIDNEK